MLFAARVGKAEAVHAPVVDRGKAGGNGLASEVAALQQHIRVGIGKGFDFGRVGRFGSRVGPQRFQPPQELLWRSGPKHRGRDIAHLPGLALWQTELQRHVALRFAVIRRVGVGPAHREPHDHRHRFATESRRRGHRAPLLVADELPGGANALGTRATITIVLAEGGLKGVQKAPRLYLGLRRERHGSTGQSECERGQRTWKTWVTRGQAKFVRHGISCCEGWGGALLSVRLVDYYVALTRGADI